MRSYANVAFDLENKPHAVGRRRFVIGAILVAAGGALAAVRTRGYDVAADRAAALLALAPWQLVVVEHAARRICAPDREDDRSIPTPDDVDVAGFVDLYVARLPDDMRSDVLALFGYVEHIAPIRVGLASRFTQLDIDDQDKVLAAMESSSIDLLRGGFAGLKSLVFMGYYRDPRTWKILGYAGPWVGRPAAGW